LNTSLAILPEVAPITAEFNQVVIPTGLFKFLEIFNSYFELPPQEIKKNVIRNIFYLFKYLEYDGTKYFILILIK